MIQLHSSSVQNSISNGRSHGHNRRLSRPGRWQVFSANQNYLQFRNILKPRHPISTKGSIQDFPIFKIYGFEQSSSQSLKHTAYHLTLQMGRIDNGTAFEANDQLQYFYFL